MVMDNREGSMNHSVRICTNTSGCVSGRVHAVGVSDSYDESRLLINVHMYV